MPVIASIRVSLYPAADAATASGKAGGGAHSSIHDPALPPSPPSPLNPLLSTSVSLSDLTVDDIGSVLDNLKLGEYTAKFAEYSVDGAILEDVETIEELADLGVDMKSIHFKRLSKAIVKYKAEGIDATTFEA